MNLATMQNLCILKLDWIEEVFLLFIIICIALFQVFVLLLFCFVAICRATLIYDNELVKLFSNEIVLNNPAA